jgi:hypothetical protein
MVVVIGRTWLGGAEGAAGRRIDDADDFVRREVAAALERGITIVPVLVDAAQMPSEPELPPPLAKLASINALELRDGSYWRVGVDRLLDALAELLGEGSSVLPAPRQQRRAPVSLAPLAIAALGALVLVVGFLLLYRVFLTPDYGPFLVVSPAVFTAPAPLGIMLAIVVVAARAARSATWVDVGLLAGLGIAAAAKGVSVLDESALGAKPGGALWVAGGVVVAAAGAVAARGLAPDVDRDPRRRPRAVAAACVVGAALLVVASVLPFYRTNLYGRAVVEHLTWSDADPIALAVAVVAGIALLYTGRSDSAAGLLVALGLASGLLWLRDTGIPLAEWLSDEGQPGQVAGAVGLVGSLAVLGAGLWLASSRLKSSAVPATIGAGSGRTVGVP